MKKEQEKANEIIEKRQKRKREKEERERKHKMTKLDIDNYASEDDTETSTTKERNLRGKKIVYNEADDLADFAKTADRYKLSHRAAGELYNVTHQSRPLGARKINNVRKETRQQAVIDVRQVLQNDSLKCLREVIKNLNEENFNI